jgi:hypothetical protein
MFVGPNIVTDGLIMVLDPSNPKSYSGGSTITNLIDGVSHSLNGTYSSTTTNGNTTLRITNNTNSQAGNNSHIQLSSLTNITTVSLWYYEHGNYTPRYLLDMRTGGSSGWIYTGGPGTNWGSGTLYQNGGSPLSVTWGNVAVLNEWRNTTVIANTPATDDMNLFSRYSDNEGMDVTFGYCLIYNRVLTESENRQNYNATKSRFI